MIRVRELTFRIANATLIGALGWLHRHFNSTTVYKFGPKGTAALFEGSWFIYRPREFGCTGNIDYVPDAENATRTALFARVRDGQVVYDIGAHGGVYTITLLHRFPGLKVHSFEPQPEELLINLALNDLPLGAVHAVAVGETADTVMMTTKERSSNHVSGRGDMAVPMVRIDDFAREKNLPPPDWIKIDIEGLELPALRGAESLIREARPTIICEINHLAGRFGTQIPDFLAYMRSLDYEVHGLMDGELKPLPEAKTFKDLGYSADWNYWFIHVDAQRI
jgi:FkbM family methyltransferase